MRQRVKGFFLGFWLLAGLMTSGIVFSEENPAQPAARGFVQNFEINPAVNGAPAAQSPQPSSGGDPFAAAAPLPGNGGPIAGMVEASSALPGKVPAVRKRIMIDAIEIKDMDVNDVLKLIAQKTGLNIIAGKDVAGRVTIFLENVEVYDALRVILGINNLAFIEELGMIRIMSDQEFRNLYGHGFGDSSEIRVVKLQGLKPSMAAEIFNQMKSPAGRVVPDDQSGTVFLDDAPSRIKAMMDYIAMADVPMVNATIALVNVQADLIAEKVMAQLTPRSGTLTFDKPSNKLFIRDSLDKVNEVRGFVKEIDVARETKSFDLSYATAEDLVKTITPMLTEGIGRIESDVRTNRVIVTDTGAKLRDVAVTVALLDRKEKEVLIEAKLIQIDLTGANSMGVDWTAILPKQDGMTMKSPFNLGTTASTFAGSSLSMGTLDGDNYTFILQMIKTMTKSRVLSSPRIAVVNNKEARILVGTNRPYITSTVVQGASGLATTADTVNFVEVGVKLLVTPTIHNDGFITMKIKPEVSSASKSLPTTGGGIPIKETSEVETTITVKDGVTIIMGGLIKDEKTNDDTKVPVLGDIPFLGAPFRSKVEKTAKTEIVIFLTPRIISGDVHVTPEVNETLGREYTR